MITVTERRDMRPNENNWAPVAVCVPQNLYLLAAGEVTDGSAQIGHAIVQIQSRISACVHDPYYAK